MRTCPQVAVAVLVEVGHAAPKSAVLPVAFGAALPDRAKPSRGNLESARPDRALTILEEREDVDSRQLRVGCEPAVLQAGESVRRADPERPVACGQQAQDLAGGEVLARRRRPGRAAHTIEAQQAGIRGQPEITVG